MVTANLRWLAGYRHPRYRVPATAEALRAVFSTPVELMNGAAAVGDPIAVLPVLFHLLWCHELGANLAVPLPSVFIWFASVVSRFVPHTLPFSVLRPLSLFAPPGKVLIQFALKRFFVR